MTALFNWLQQHVWLLTALSTAAVLYWRFLDRYQKLYERQNEAFQKVLENKWYKEEGRDLELEITFRYCFNHFLRAAEIRWLLEKSVSLLDLKDYSRLRSSSIIELDDGRIRFIGPCRPLNNKGVRRAFLALTSITSLFFFIVPFWLSYSNQPQQPGQGLDLFILSLCLLFFSFLCLRLTLSILRGHYLRSEYNDQS